MTKRISILFLASAALHAAVLGLVHLDSPQTIQAGSPFRVTIQAPSPASDGEIPEPGLEPVEQAAKKDSVSETIKTVPIPYKQAIPTQVSKPEISRQQDETGNQQETVAVAVESIQHKEIKNSSLPPRDPGASHTGKSSQPKPKVVSLLRADLEQAFALHFQYPRLAIKLGWQGEVQLSIHIDANGKLTKISILQSSGYELLDEAAMESLKNIGVLPEAIVLLNGQSLDMVLPVKYILL